MGISKIEFGGHTLLDLTNDTVTADKLLSGATAHDKAGNLITGAYAVPSGTVPITANGTYDVTNYVGAQVKVPVPEDYISTASTVNYTTKFSAGKVIWSSDTLIANTSILTIGFKPKIFILKCYGGFSVPVNTSSTAGKQYITSSYFCYDNDYSNIICHPDTEDTDTYTRTSTGFYTVSSTARSQHSQSGNNCFEPTDNGVKGNGSSACSMYFYGGQSYLWFAWG